MAATETTEAPKKTRKAQGPRTPKPIFALVSYKDADGNAVRLDVENLDIQFTKDSAELVTLLTGPDAGKYVVKSVTLPAPAKRAAPTS